MVLSFTAPWLPYLAYILEDLPSWIGQTRGYGPRFELLNPHWYWNNLLQEYHRYGPGLGPLSWRYLLRPGFWAALIVLPASLVALAGRTIRRGDQAARALVVPALVFPVLFALMILLKLANYLVTLIPLGAVIAAWGSISLWRWAGRDGKWRWVQAVLMALLLAVTAEGLTRIAALEAAAKQSHLTVALLRVCVFIFLTALGCSVSTITGLGCMTWTIEPGLFRCRRPTQTTVRPHCRWPRRWIISLLTLC